MIAERHVLDDRGKCRWCVVDCDGTECAAFTEVQCAELGAAEPGRVFQHGLENRLQLAGRTADDLQHLRGRGLLLKRLGESLPGLSEFAGPDFELRFQLGGQ
jgi:hypothetical protein